MPIKSYSPSSWAGTYASYIATTTRTMTYSSHCIDSNNHIYVHSGIDRGGTLDNVDAGWGINADGSPDFVSRFSVVSSEASLGRVWQIREYAGRIYRLYSVGASLYIHSVSVAESGTVNKQSVEIRPTSASLNWGQRTDVGFGTLTRNYGADFAFLSGGTGIIVVSHQYDISSGLHRNVWILLTLNSATGVITQNYARSISLDVPAGASLWYPKVCAEGSDATFYVSALVRTSGGAYNSVVIKAQPYVFFGNTFQFMWTQYSDYSDVVGSIGVNYEFVRWRSLDIVNGELWHWTSRYGSSYVNYYMILERYTLAGSFISRRVYVSNTADYGAIAQGVAYNSDQTEMTIAGHFLTGTTPDVYSVLHRFDITGANPVVIDTIGFRSTIKFRTRVRDISYDRDDNLVVFSEVHGDYAAEDRIIAVLRLGSDLWSFDSETGDWDFPILPDLLSDQGDSPYPSAPTTVTAISNSIGSEHTVAAPSPDLISTILWLDTSGGINAITGMDLNRAQSLSLVEIEREYNTVKRNWVAFLSGTNPFFNTTTPLSITPHDIAVDSAGSVYVLTSAIHGQLGGATWDLFLYKLNTDGSLAWVRAVGNAFDDRSNVGTTLLTSRLKVVFSGNNSVIVGQIILSSSSSFSEFVALHEFNFSGTRVAEHTFINDVNTQREALMDLDSVVNQFVLACSLIRCTGRTGFFVAYTNHRQGLPELPGPPFIVRPNQSARYFVSTSGESGSFWYPECIYINRSNNRFIYIGFNSDGYNRACIFKFNIETGTVLWAKQFSVDQYSLTAPYRVHAVQDDSAGNLYAATQVYTGSKHIQIVHKLDGANGNVLWTRSFSHSLVTTGSYLSLMLNQSQDRVFVVGDSGFISLNASTGAIQWAKWFRYGPRAIERDNNGNLFILTQELLNSYANPAVLKINANSLESYFETIWTDPIYLIDNGSTNSINNFFIQESNTVSVVDITVVNSDASEGWTDINDMAIGTTGTPTTFTISKKYDLDTPVQSVSIPISLNSFYAGAGLVPANTIGVFENVAALIPSSGQISINQFYESPNFYTVTLIEDSTFELNLRSTAISAGWDQIRPLRFVIPSGRVVNSDDRSEPALRIEGSFPGGLELVNRGYILGMGGRGGNARNAGQAGGNAILIATSLVIDNQGIIAGGGGGGGAGYEWEWATGLASTPGSGGGSGINPAFGGTPLSISGVAGEDSRDVIKFDDVVVQDAVQQPGGGLYYSIGAGYYWFASADGSNNQLVFADTTIDEEPFIELTDTQWPVVVGGWVYQRNIASNTIVADGGVYYEIRRLQDQQDNIYESPGRIVYFNQGGTNASPGGAGGEWGLSGRSGNRAYNSGAYALNDERGYIGGVAGRATSVVSGLSNAYSVTWKSLGRVYGAYNSGLSDVATSPGKVPSIVEGPLYTSGIYEWRSYLNLIIWGGVAVVYIPTELGTVTVYSLNGYTYYRGVEVSPGIYQIRRDTQNNLNTPYI